MALSFAVSTIFGARDENTKAFNRMSRNASLFGKKSSRAFKDANKSASLFKTTVGSILTAGAISKVFGQVSHGASAVATGFVNFDQAITSAAAKFKNLDLSTKEGQRTFEQLRKTARLVGRDTEFSADKAGQGLDFLALAGFNAQQSMSLLPGVANLATVANLDLGQATDIASDSLGAFGLMTNDTAQLAQNFSRVQDVMARTTATSNTNLTDLFESVKKGGAAFTSAGQTMETFNALAGQMANSGLKAAESGTQLRNIVLRLAGPTKEAGDLLNQLGVKTADQSGNFRDVVDILADFEKGLKGMGTQQKSAAISTIFGARAVTGVNILLKSGTKTLRDYRQSLIDSGGASADMAKIMRGSLLNRLKSLGSAAMEVGFQFLDAFSVQGGKAISSLTNFVRKIDMTPVINFFKSAISIGQKMFEKFMKIGQTTGLFAKLGELTRELSPLFATLYDVVKTVFNTLSDAGVFNFIAQRFKNLIDVVIILAKTFKWMWFNVLKPIIVAIGKIIEPIISLMTKVSEFKGDILGGVKNLFSAQTAGEQGPASDAAARRALTNVERQPPSRVEVATRTRAEISGRLDIAGAPEGSTAVSDTPGFDLSMLGMAGGA